MLYNTLAVAATFSPWAALPSLSLYHLGSLVYILALQQHKEFLFALSAALTTRKGKACLFLPSLPSLPLSLSLFIFQPHSFWSLLLTKCLIRYLVFVSSSSFMLLAVSLSLYLYGFFLSLFSI